MNSWTACCFFFLIIILVGTFTRQQHHRIFPHGMWMLENNRCSLKWLNCDKNIHLDTNKSSRCGEWNSSRSRCRRLMAHLSNPDDGNLFLSIYFFFVALLLFFFVCHLLFVSPSHFLSIHKLNQWATKHGERLQKWRINRWERRVDCLCWRHD